MVVIAGAVFQKVLPLPPDKLVIDSLALDRGSPICESVAVDVRELPPVLSNSTPMQTLRPLSRNGGRCGLTAKTFGRFAWPTCAEPTMD